MGRIISIVELLGEPTARRRRRSRPPSTVAQRVRKHSIGRLCARVLLCIALGGVALLFLFLAALHAVQGQSERAMTVRWVTPDNIAALFRPRGP